MPLLLIICQGLPKQDWYPEVLPWGDRPNEVDEPPEGDGVEVRLVPVRFSCLILLSSSFKTQLGFIPLFKQF